MAMEYIHWYIFDGCNLNCVPCFQPHMHDRTTLERPETLAEILVENRVKRVTLTGGEPTLEPHLDAVLKILKQGEIYISLHTNGTTLNDDRIDSLVGLVDDIGLPIDSTNRETQKRLRGDGFMSVFDRLSAITRRINKREIGLGWHTIFTTANTYDQFDVYDLINQHRFDYWRIYEFNDFLAYTSLAMKLICTTPKEHEEYRRRMDEIATLRGTTDLMNRDDDPLTPAFQVSREQFSELQDPRIQFVAIQDAEEPYAFLDSRGDITIYDWLSGMKRIAIGNIIRQGFSSVAERFERYCESSEALRARV